MKTNLLILLILSLVLIQTRRHHHQKHHNHHLQNKKTNEKVSKSSSNTKSHKTISVKRNKKVSMSKKNKKKQECDIDKESMCGEEEQKFLSVSHVNIGADCFVKINYCLPSSSCRFQSMSIGRDGQLASLDGSQSSDNNSKCVWIGVSTSQANFFTHIAVKLNNETFLAAFKKLLSSSIDYDYIITKLDDIGMGGLFIGDLTIMGGMDIMNMEMDGPSAGGRYDPSSTFQGFDSDNDFKAMKEGKQPTGIYAKRQEGNNPHMQKVMWGKKRRFHHN